MFQWLQQLFSTDAKSAPSASTPAAPPPAAAPAEPAAPPAPAPRVPAAAATTHTAPVSFDQRDSVNARYYNWLFDGDDSFALETTEAENQVLDALSTILASQQSGAALVRRLPGLIPQLLQSLRSDTFSGAQLSRLISSDVVLVAAVLRLANSSYSWNGTAITSIEHAIMLIGTEGLRHLITSVAFRPIIDMNSGHYTRTLAPRLWDQCERCAVANRTLAVEQGIDPFEAFLAGLVQYTGLIVTLRIMDQADKDGSQIGSEMFCARLLRDARTLSCSIGREWHFPDSVVTAIAEQAGMRKGVQLSPMGSLLTQADYLGKVRMLADAGLLDASEPSLFAGLPPAALACYHTLDPLTADLPQADSQSVLAP